MIDLDSKADHRLGGVNCALTANLWPAFVKKSHPGHHRWLYQESESWVAEAGQNCAFVIILWLKRANFLLGQSVAAAIDSDIFGLNTGMELARALISGTEIGPD